ncbi:MAG: hypothetical protein QF790_06080 [Gammaproteobacteria bacterium]|jgi:hypothetical protein|nr:hypothetical protein [Gammaproteobacteria bacterium]MDP6616716.1 hypothetical protein [Gammaproteobacteria bacterium]MDP6695219.1 hypothetical protein [Gammaproteobacteria bacterium]MDP7041191.1 hypothetical protein [Gammaproteobacteria bacterium]
MADIPVCWRCGRGLEDLNLPFGRLDECPECRSQLHVCRMCIFFDPAAIKECREDDADEVRGKERANFCDYFQANSNAFDESIAAADRDASEQLEQLFGDKSPAKGKSNKGKSHKGKSKKKKKSSGKKANKPVSDPSPEDLFKK